MCCLDVDDGVEPCLMNPEHLSIDDDRFVRVSTRSVHDGHRYNSYEEQQSSSKTPKSPKGARSDLFIVEIGWRSGRNDVFCCMHLDFGLTITIKGGKIKQALVFV